MRVGYEWVHSLVDDHSRYAYSELHRDEQRAKRDRLRRARPRALRRATGSRQDDCSPTTPWSTATTARSRELLARHGVRHLLIPPAARSQRQGRALPANPQTRMGARPDLPLLRPPRPSPVTLAQHYNERRPHSSLGGRPPISRVHNVPRPARAGRDRGRASAAARDHARRSLAKLEKFDLQQLQARLAAGALPWATRLDAEALL